MNRRRFEARIEGEGAAAETVGEEDDSAEEPSTTEPPPIVPAQRARDLAVGDSCELLAGFELAGRTGVVAVLFADGFSGALALDAGLKRPVK